MLCRSALSTLGQSSEAAGSGFASRRPDCGGISMPRSAARSRLKSGWAIAASLMLTVASIVVVPPAVAAAADQGTGKSPVLSPTADQVTADALPTVQVDGMVWSQATIGNTVYAGGKFANARPAGAAAGTNLTPRANLLAYDITTGALKTGFVPPALNGQVLAVAASPDGQRIYAAGEFTTVGGSSARNRVAAFDATTGALITTFNVNVGSRVKSIVATNDTVYIGGQFTAANGQPRARLAAFRADNGALTTWAPQADYTVNAMVLSPDKSRLVLGGGFQNINGSPAYGLAAVDIRSSALLPFAANQKVRNAGPNAAITSLSTDGSSVYGTGYHYGAGGNLEGTFAVDPISGEIRWIEDCHGDTYSVWATSAAVYTTSHAHYCGNIGGFFQSNPWSTNQRFALAFSKGVTGTIGSDPHGYTNWQGNPSPSLINWFPDFKTGTVSGQNQAGWNIVGSGQYISVGGEFPQVNGTGQQGLVRFATKPPAPGKSGPMLTGSKFTPSLVSLTKGTVRVAFSANWDRDDMNLTYKVVRNSNTAAPVYTTTATSTYWDRPSLGFTDTGLAPGDYRYRVFATDKDGNQVGGDTVSVTVPADGPELSPYSRAVKDQGANLFWRLGEASGTTAYDWAGFNDGAVGPAVTRGAAGAISGDSNTASTFDGATGTVVAGTQTLPPSVYSTELWFKTATSRGGKLIGFGSAQQGLSGSYDRHVYMQDDGRLVFGTYTGVQNKVTSPKAYNDGQWHHVVATQGPDGMKLYVDGAIAGTNKQTAAQNYTGYWRIGGDKTWGSTSSYFAGALDEAAVYPVVLTADQVKEHYALGSGTGPANIVPSADFAMALSYMDVAVNGSGSTDPDGSIATYRWDFGDGSSGSGQSARHSYDTPGDYTVTLTVTDNRGGTASTSRTVGAAAAP
ncbi:PKD domain-containing protein [Nakamurella flava]|uniref:PKD domain-containing protein n=1 Tax=Nakamurella flava TaxID=2576308 RepID=A0A4U6QM68_9ACTN|nr:LamG-like jellyroll fold domain-containing protein [Nakamurella flava]TKV61700.1 PKD domain-containing protein [Nakamurella flava]